jgi:predicted nucleic acid-binding Zn ribbon protein
MKKVKDVLHVALGNDEVLRAARAQAAMRRWAEVVGPTLAERSHPDRYGRGTVWVAVQGSAWAQELRMMKDKILTRLGEISGEPSLFNDVRFGVRPLPERFTPAPAPTPKPDDVDVKDLSIREIAERRLARWKDEGRG